MSWFDRSNSEFLTGALNRKRRPVSALPKPVMVASRPPQIYVSSDGQVFPTMAQKFAHEDIVRAMQTAERIRRNNEQIRRLNEQIRRNNEQMRRLNRH